MSEFPPGLLLVLGALLIPLLRGHWRNAWMLALPLAGLWGLTQIAPGAHFQFELFGQTLTPVRVDKLSLVFGYIFHIAAAITIIYAFHVKDAVQAMAGMIYAGCAIGAVFAGDLISLFVYWEGTAISSVFLIWASRTESAYRAGIRYLIYQVSSGVLLLGGAIWIFNQTGSLAFDKMTLSGPGPVMVFLAFGIKAAFPLLHNWLQDSYPKATVTGTVFLSAFTTKLAIYALARGFPGTDMLIWIGATMAVFPIFYALIENDLRKVLAYSLNHQLGFMVIGVGIGTELALNGAAAHAFASILYKSVLFMSVGAVLFRTGTAQASELGGLHKSMPWTTRLCFVGSASISSFPLLVGFVSKSMIVSAAAYEHHILVWLLLLLAGAGAILHSGIRIPYSAFYAKDSGKRPEEAPANMLIAMGIAAFLCIALGVYPQALYDLLPYTAKYAPYTVSHVVTQLQLILFAGLVFGFMLRKNLYLADAKALNLDFDWVFRRLFTGLIEACIRIFGPVDRAVREGLLRQVGWIVQGVFRHHGPEGMLARTWPTGSTVLWVAVLLALYMIFYFI